MARFRAQAELRRLHREAPWVLQGVWVFAPGSDDGLWRGWQGASGASGRDWEAGLVRLEDLGHVLAPSEKDAAKIGFHLAALRGFHRTGPPLLGYHEERVELPDEMRY